MTGNTKDWLEAQVSVLGSVLLDGSLAGAVLLRTAPEDYSGAYRTIFEAVRTLFRAHQPIDPVTVRGQLGADYSPILQQIMEVTPTAANWEAYVERMLEQSRLLRLQELADGIREAKTLEEARGLVSKANETLSLRQAARILPMRGSVPGFLERHRTEKQYLPWGFRELDRSLYCESGDFVILGGYPSAGKTALALASAWRQSEDKRVGFYSLETSEYKLQDRAMTMISKVPFDRIKRNQLSEDDVCGAALAARQIDRHSLDLIQASSMTVDDIQALTLAKGYEIIYIDYVQLIRPTDSRRSRTEQVAQISMDLHRMAQDTGVTVVGLSQLSRDDGEKAPKMSSLRESGQLEQDADVVLLLYKEEPNHPRSRRCLKVAKNKEGEIFGVMLAFDGATQTFKESAAGPLIERRRQEPEYKQVSFRELAPQEGGDPWCGSETG